MTRTHINLISFCNNRIYDFCAAFALHFLRSIFYFFMVLRTVLLMASYQTPHAPYAANEKKFIRSEYEVWRVIYDKWNIAHRIEME